MESISESLNPKIEALLSRMEDPSCKISMPTENLGVVKIYNGSNKIGEVNFAIATTNDDFDLGIPACLGAYEVRWAESNLDIGPVVYDAALEWTTFLGSGLINDRKEVRDGARNVWRKYMDIRPDVEKHQLDVPHGATATTFDDCSDLLSAETYGIGKAYPYGQVPHRNYNREQYYIDRMLSIKTGNDTLSPSGDYVNYINSNKDIFHKMYTKPSPNLLRWFLKRNKLTLEHTATTKLDELKGYVGL